MHGAWRCHKSVLFWGGEREGCQGVKKSSLRPAASGKRQELRLTMHDDARRYPRFVRKKKIQRSKQYFVRKATRKSPDYDTTAVPKCVPLVFAAATCRERKKEGQRARRSFPPLTDLPRRQNESGRTILVQKKKKKNAPCLSCGWQCRATTRTARGPPSPAKTLEARIRSSHARHPDVACPSHSLYICTCSMSDGVYGGSVPRWGGVEALIGAEFRTTTTV